MFFFLEDIFFFIFGRCQNVQQLLGAYAAWKRVKVFHVLTVSHS